jgi:hypothetical protein
MNLISSLGKMATQAAQKIKDEMTGEQIPTEQNTAIQPKKSDKT